MNWACPFLVAIVHVVHRHVHMRLTKHALHYPAGVVSVADEKRAQTVS
jgi:hypothetical protein